MSFKIVPAEKSEVTKILCPHCKDRLPRVALKKGSKCSGVTFTCRRCGMLWEIKSE